MELLEIMQNRRSIRKYKDEDIPKEKLEKILQAGLLALGMPAEKLKPHTLEEIDWNKVRNVDR